jgi:PAS domain S-box-containing protein
MSPQITTSDNAHPPHEEISAERFRDLLESVDAIILEADPSTLHLTYVSAGSRRILGVSPEQWRERENSWADHLRPEDRERALGGEREIVERGKPVSVEYRMVGGNGQLHWFRDTLHLVNGANGKPTVLRRIMVDVTERREAEKALRQSEEKYRFIVFNIPDVVWVMDAHGRILFVSPSSEFAWGYAPEDFYAGGLAYFLTTVHPDDLRRPTESLQAAFLHGRPREVGFRWRHKDGRWNWYRARTAGVFEKDGVLYLQGLLTDITERKRAEEALQASENKYRTLVLNIPDVAWTLNSEFHFPFISPRIESFSGFTTGEIYRRGADILFECIHPEDRLKVKNAMESLFARGQPYDIECRVRRKTGGWVWVRDRVVATYERDGARYADGLLSHITGRTQVEEALRESEKRYRSLVDNATVGIYRTTPDGRILTANPALIKKPGYTDFQSLAARNLEAEGFEPSYPRTPVRERIEQERQVVGMEEAWTRRDGSVIWVRESAQAIQDEDGKTLCYEGIVEDITERKQAQTALADRLRFETLLAELSGRFVHLPTEQIDGEIVDPQRRVCECLALDTCSLWQVRTEAPDFISLAHVYRRPGNAPIPERINADQDFPGSAKQIVAGKVAAFSSREELPTEAGRDRQTFQLLGN